MWSKCLTRDLCILVSDCHCWLATKCALRNLTYSKVCLMRFKAPAGNTFQAIWLAGGHVIRTNAFMNCSVIQYAIMLGTWYTQYSSTEKYTYMTTTIIGVSLSEPYIDHDNGPCTQKIMLSIYVPMYVSFSPCLSHPGSWDPCMPWNAIRHIDMLMCVYNCTQLNSKDDWTTRVCHQDWSANR